MSKILTRHGMRVLRIQQLNSNSKSEIRILFFVYSANALNCFSFKRERERVYALPLKIFENILFCLNISCVCLLNLLLLLLFMLYAARRGLLNGCVYFYADIYIFKHVFMLYLFIRSPSETWSKQIKMQLTSSENAAREMTQGEMLESKSLYLLFTLQSILLLLYLLLFQRLYVHVTHTPCGR